MKRRSTVSGKPAKVRRPKASRSKRVPPPNETSHPTSSPAGTEGEVARLTSELNEARERQTATSEVLGIISGSSGEIQGVFDAILANATRLCEANFGTMTLHQDGVFRLAAAHNVPRAYTEIRQRDPVIRSGPLTRGAATKQPFQIHDCSKDPAYKEDDGFRVFVDKAGGRSAVGIPMLKDQELIGAITIFRQEVRPFTDKQIDLVKNFAAQAVIAIENARLLNELRQRTTDLTERTTDLTEALEQQTATSKVLQVISSSPGDLEPVFATMLENAVRICDARFGNIYRWGGEVLLLVATENTPPAFAEARKSGPLRHSPNDPIGRMIATKAVVHTDDLAKEQEYIERSNPGLVAAVELGNVRTSLVAPILKEDELIGAFALSRQQVRPFTDKQIELVQNFAAQAAVAIENARLLNELRQSLDQQTATSQVLQVISSSPGDLEQVFAIMLENATRICEAKFGALYLSQSDGFRATAMHNAPPAYEEARAGVVHPPPSSSLWRAANTKQAFQIADVTLEQGYIERDPFVVSAVALGGYRSVLSVPMLHEDELVGVITIFRQEVRPFSDKQIELVQNFAAQAVIAIENARLLNELRQSLEQQTATSEVLQVISSAPGDLEPIFATMLERAARICDAKFAALYRLEGDGLRLTATHDVPPPFAEAQGTVFHPAPGGALDAVMTTGRTAHLSDLAAARSYVERHPRMVEAVEIAGIRTTLGVPMVKDNKLIGIIGIFRQEVRPFDDKQIALVTNFANQAVIAIENARLLRELREKTEDVVKLNQHLEQRVADQVGEIERMSRLRRFLPPQVADLIVASGAEKQLESHRREITALFCDLRGFTGFTESADAEDVMALLRDYHASIGEKIIKYNGTLERYAGDGVMVVFNDPVPVENPALQAVLMALEVRDALGALTATWSRLGHEIGFGIGIAHGFATLGTIGFEGRFDYAAIGTVSNVASRLCDEAKPGQILISPRVLTKVENAVRVEPVGEFELKGIRRPLAAYNVVGAQSSET